MRAVISKYDKSHLNWKQQDLLKDLLHKMSPVPGSDTHWKGSHYDFTARHEYKIEIRQKTRFNTYRSYQELRATVDDEILPAYASTSVSRYLAHLIAQDKLFPKKGTVPTPVKAWKDPDPPPKPAPKPESTANQKVVYGEGWVEIFGVRLKRFEKPGPLTPAEEAVTEPMGVDKELKLVALALKHCYPALLIGDTGTGKTTLVEYLAYICNVNLLKVIGDPEYGPSLWLGHLHAKGGDTYWADGDLPTAMKGVEGNGQTWLFVDELSRMMADNTSPLLPVLEVRGGRHGRLRLADNPESDGKMVESHPDFRVVMAMNPFDGDFAGTNEVDKALLRRARVPLELNYPNPAAQEKILRGKFPNVHSTVIQKVVKVAEALREDRRQQRIGLPVSPDELETWLTLAPELGLKTAAEVALLNKATEDDRPRIREQLEKVG